MTTPAQNQSLIFNYLVMITQKVHISSIKIGDTILHNDEIKTVCKRVLKKCDFMGVSLFGDSYNLGHKPVIKINF